MQKNEIELNIMCNLNIAGIVNDSITDGPGLRYTLFLQGCPHHCDGCHNPQTWNTGINRLININEVLEQIKSNPLLQGVTFSGGEPMLQAQNLIPLAQEIKKLNLNIAIYTGYTFEQLLKINNCYQIELLKIADILIDGKFEKDKKDYRLKFCGSTNQRIIDLKQSFTQNKLVFETSEKWNNI